MIKQRENSLLIIGIDNYKSAHFSNLINAVLDCENLIKVLTTEYNFNVVSRIYNDQATRKRIIDEITFLSTSILPEDNLIVYFAGHGRISQSNKGFWVPYDADDGSVSNLIPNSVIKDLIDDIEAKHIFLISDSCFSGSFLSNTRQVYDEGHHYEKLDFDKSRWYLASGRNESVSDGKAGEGSPFGRALLNVLTSNCDKYISTLQIIASVTKITGSGSIQQPIGGPIQDVGHENGQMVLMKKENQVDNISHETFNGLMRAYGFLKGQELLLSQIERMFKELRTDILKIKITWDLAFGAAENIILHKLLKFTGLTCEQFNDMYVSKLYELFSIEINTQMKAEEYIDLIHQRSKGNIESPVIEYLLVNTP
jgi:hypothetical protein